MAERKDWSKRRLEMLCAVRTAIFHHFHELSHSTSTVQEHVSYQVTDRLRIVLETIDQSSMSRASSRSGSPCPSETFSYDIFLPNAALGVPS